MTCMVSFRPRGHSLNLLGSRGFIRQKVYFSRLLRVYAGLIMLVAFLLLCIDKSGLACCLYALRAAGAILVVFSGVGVKFAQSSSQWEAGPIPADQLKARKPGLSTSQ
jgi:hypothetical protein